MLSVMLLLATKQFIITLLLLILKYGFKITQQKPYEDVSALFIFSIEKSLTLHHR